MAEYVLGIDGGTESIRAGIFDAHGACLAYGTSPNTNIHRHAGWAEQSIAGWEDGLIGSIRSAVQAAGIDPSEIRGIGLDGTSCTVICLDDRGQPLRDAVMWMDVRASREAEEIAACGDPALKYVGHSNVSAEWFPCKVLWLKRNEPEVFAGAKTIFEHTDWLAYRLTGEISANINTTTIRWFYNDREGGPPVSLYEAIGLGDVFEKLPQRVLKIGEPVGPLSREMAEKTGLAQGIPVAAGGADAYIGVIGVNALQPGTLALITGSSQLQIGISEIELHARGLFGSFPDAILPGCHVVEAGQISTGSILNWFTAHFANRETAGEAEKRGCSVYDVLGERAEQIDPGSEGLLVLEHWQGNRTPWVDANSRGVIRGLTLKHTPAHIFRAIMEGVAYGTAVILERMEQERLRIEQIIACGGATKSDLWMQIMADVTGKRISIPKEQEAVSLGSAIAGMVAAGIYPDIRSAADATVQTAKTVDPNLENTEYYKEYVRQYVVTYEKLAEESKKLVATIRPSSVGD